MFKELSQSEMTSINGGQYTGQEMQEDIWTAAGGAVGSLFGPIGAIAGGILGREFAQSQANNQPSPYTYPSDYIFQY